VGDVVSQAFASALQSRADRGAAGVELGDARLVGSLQLARIGPHLLVATGGALSTACLGGTALVQTQPRLDRLLGMPHLLGCLVEHGLDL
jgi:hypothetical protein